MLNPFQLQTIGKEKMQVLQREAQKQQLLKDKPLRATWKKENNKLRIIWVGSHSNPILVKD